MYNYTISEDGITKDLEVTYCEKDLGVFIDPLLDFEEHITSTVKKARRLSGLIIRTITFKSKDIMIPLFKSIIRPVLEYANVVWSPYYRKHIDQIESIQRHFTRCVIGMKDLDYEERMRALKLPSLEYRRLRGDLIETYKITHNLYDPLTTNSLLTLSLTNTRSHNYKLAKPRFNTKKFQNFYSNRIINKWNNLPGKVVNAKSLNCFKTYIDAHFKDYMYGLNFNVD